MNPLRIAMITQPWNPLPPMTDVHDYPQVHHLANALVCEHHNVQICASGPSHCDARLIITGATSTDGRHDPHRMHEHLLVALESTRKFRADIIHDFTAQAAAMLPAFGLDVPLLSHISAEPSVELLRALQTSTSTRGVNQVFVTDNPWLPDLVPDIRWHAVVRRPVGLSDCLFSARRLPYLVYEGPVDSSCNLPDLVRTAAGLGVPLKVINNLEQVTEQAYVANCLGGAAEVARSHVDFVTDADSLTRRRILSEAIGFIVASPQVSRLQHTIARALASGTPILLVGEPNSIEPALLDGITSITTQVGKTDSITRERLLSLDPYECRRIAALEFNPMSAARGWESVYRGLLAQAAANNSRHLLELPA